MNIKQAKQEIINTVQAYLTKDETGEYAIPVERQRPVLLIGPPGIGKTAIMEQVAQECGINLVSYTITHHTRQSAIGLPFISKKTYDGEDVSVTEYTMSEIIASIYDQIEQSGIHEGILFLDEINCVSETLAPTMLQFLQYKTFGNHRVPDGFVIVTAGNPPEYNKSVRDFDIVTYDRVKRIYIEEDFSVWKEYAYKAQIHGAILSYLEIKKNNFYSVVSDLDGKRFVTARGWEDLSQVMKVYEQLGFAIDYDFVVQYLQDGEIARDFAAYYELYNKYKNIYRIPEILEGSIPENSMTIKNAPFDEKLSLLGLLLDSLGQEFISYSRKKAAQEAFFEQLGFAIDYDFVVQYLQDGEIARDFAAYYELYNKYKNIYRIPEILEGSIPENSMTIKNAPFDEKLSLLGLLLDSLGQEFISYSRKKAAQEAFFEQLGFLRSDLKEGVGSGKEILERQISSYDTMITHRKKAGMIDREQEKAMCAALQAMNDCLMALAVEGTGDAKGDFLCVKKLFDEREQIRQKEISDAGRHLTHAFEFLARVFGEGQEMVIFLSELSAGYYSLKFVSECGNDAYYKYNKLLLLKERTQELKDEAMELLGL